MQARTALVLVALIVVALVAALPGLRGDRGGDRGSALVAFESRLGESPAVAKIRSSAKNRYVPRLPPLAIAGSAQRRRFERRKARYLIRKAAAKNASLSVVRKDKGVVAGAAAKPAGYYVAWNPFSEEAKDWGSFFNKEFFSFLHDRLVKNRRQDSSMPYGRPERP